MNNIKHKNILEVNTWVIYQLHSVVVAAEAYSAETAAIAAVYGLYWYYCSVMEIAAAVSLAAMATETADADVTAFG